ncbi:MAG: DEAD/DEAH box helicase [Filifactoraceae bacterium]
MKFDKFKIDSEYVKLLEKQFITEATPVQEAVIPPMLKGRDIIAKAQTGTGKTLSFVLPILNNIDKENNHTQALILAPTRELSEQITEVIAKLGEIFDIGVVPVYGGHNVEGQISKLRNNVKVVVGTPGRILDHLRRGTINFKYLRTLVIDEADQMLDMGFLEDIELLSGKIPKNLQVAMLSATMPDQIIKLGKQITKNPVLVEINKDIVVIEKIKQIAVHTTEERKFDSLNFVLDIYKPFMTIIFAGSKKGADELHNKMIEMGRSDMDVLHGDLSQNKREAITKKFRNLELPILITTDIAARGMDFEGVSHVINYDLPKNLEYYVHRVGRTGRKGNDGVAVSLVSDKDEKYLDKIKKMIKISIPEIYDRGDYEREKINLEAMREVEIVEKKQYKPKSVYLRDKAKKEKSFKNKISANKGGAKSSKGRRK